MRRTIRRYPVGDERLTVTQIANRAGLHPQTIRDRIARGMKGADLLRPSVAALFDVGGELLTRHEMAARAGVTLSGLVNRMSRGLVGKDLVRRDLAKPAARYQVGDEMLTLQQIASRAGVSVSAIRYRLAKGETGESLVNFDRFSDPGDSRFARPRRGAPGAGESVWDGEAEKLATAVAATWRSSLAGSSQGRLRRALMAHSPRLLRLFRNGGRVLRFGRALAAQGVTLDNGHPLQPKAVVGAWARVEAALMRRLAAQKAEAA